MLRHVFLLSIFSRLFFFFFLVSLAKVNEKIPQRVNTGHLKFNAYRLTILIVDLQFMAAEILMPKKDIIEKLSKYYY